jgi:cytochrome c biogenesis protein CcmG/thiol:disulfide interchange protein DsbE
MNSRVKLFIPLIIFAVLAVLFWRGLSLDPTAMPSALLNKPVPEFSLPPLDDDTKIVSRDIFMGKTSLLNIWATWCPPCYVEHPFLVKLAEQGVPIIGVNYKDDVIDATKWLEELHNPYVVVIRDADGRLGLDLGVSGWPETYVVDKQGIIRYKHVGVVDQKVWTETLQPLMQSLK